MTVVLLLLTVAVVLGLVGWFASGLMWLFVIGLIVLMADLVLFGVLLGRGRSRTRSGRRRR